MEIIIVLLSWLQNFCSDSTAHGFMKVKGPSKLWNKLSRHQVNQIGSNADFLDNKTDNLDNQGNSRNSQTEFIDIYIVSI